ncbi:MAG: YsnF/AvaK domain-containing protein [Bryobacteraceae bacterium]
MSNVVSDDTSKSSSRAAETESTLVIPVIEERLDVSKELQTTGVVRVQKYVREQDVVISEPLTAETVHVERVPMDLVVESAPAIRTEGDVTVIPVVEEVLVTTKQLRLVEEVRITRVRSTSVHQENVTLRSEQVSVDRQTPVSSQQTAKERSD